VNSLLAINYYCSRPLLINNKYTRLPGAKLESGWSNSSERIARGGKKGAQTETRLEATDLRTFRNRDIYSFSFRLVKNSESICHFDNRRRSSRHSRIFRDNRHRNRSSLMTSKSNSVGRATFLKGSTPLSAGRCRRV